jgi:hypothetical protein
MGEHRQKRGGCAIRWHGKLSRASNYLRHIANLRIRKRSASLTRGYCSILRRLSIAASSDLCSSQDNVNSATGICHRAKTASTKPKKQLSPRHVATPGAPSDEPYPSLPAGPSGRLALGSGSRPVKPRDIRTIVVPTVLAIGARRSCRRHALSENPPAAMISNAVIPFLPDRRAIASARCSFRDTGQSTAPPSGILNRQTLKVRHCWCYCSRSRSVRGCRCCC